MKQEYMTLKQFIFAIIIFIFGNSVILGFRTNVAQDTWISLFMAIIPVILIVLVYARIMNLYPHKNLFDIMQDVFKPVIGKVFIVLMIFYATLVGAIVVCLFNDFIRMTSLNMTPELIVTFTFVSTSFYIASSRINAYARGGVTVVYILVLTVLITILISLGQMFKTDHLYPIADHSIKELAGGAWIIFAKPFAEVVLFLGIADTVIRKKGDSPYKAFVFGVLIGAVILLSTHLRNLLLIGPALIENSYFPSHRAARIVGIPEVLERIEGLITYNFMIAGIGKVTVALLFAAKGASKLFGTSNYKSLLMPLALLFISACYMFSNNVVEIFDFLKVYKYFAMPFQVIIPLIVWIGAEIKSRRQKQEEDIGASGAEQ